MKNNLIESQIKSVLSAKNKSLEKLKILVFKALDLNKKKIKKAVELVEASKDLSWNEMGEVDQWYRIDLSELIPDFLDLENAEIKPFVQDYFSENDFCTIDFENEVLKYSIGPAIIINDLGDVLDQDSGKWIVSKNDYESENERNILIETWMEKQGYFPSVIYSDRHGNCFYVNTKEVSNE